MENNVDTMLQDSTDELLRLLSSFNQEGFNTVPFEGSWTAGQVAEHLLKSDTSFLKTLYGKTKPTERPPDKNVEAFRSVLLNFETKLKSPGHIVPSDEKQVKETIIQSLKGTRAQLSEAVQTLGLSETCLDIPKVLGELTRTEVIYFIIFHTQRHNHQLKNIFQSLIGKPSLVQ